MSVPNQPTYQTGNSLLAKCENENWGLCLGYLQAVSDAYRTAAAWYKFEPDLCVPVGVLSGQLQKVWIKYANEHPEDLHLTASSLVMKAYMEASPCD